MPQIVSIINESQTNQGNNSQYAQDIIIPSIFLNKSQDAALKNDNLTQPIFEANSNNTITQSSTYNKTFDVISEQNQNHIQNQTANLTINPVYISNSNLTNLSSSISTEELPKISQNSSVPALIQDIPKNSTQQNQITYQPIVGDELSQVVHIQNISSDNKNQTNQVINQVLVQPLTSVTNSSSQKVEIKQKEIPVQASQLKNSRSTTESLNDFVFWPSQPAWMTPFQWKNYLILQVENDYQAHLQTQSTQQLIDQQQLDTSNSPSPINLDTTQVSQSQIQSQNKTQQQKVTDIENEVNITVQRMQVNIDQSINTYNTIVINSAQALQCNKQCVSICLTLIKTLDDQFKCLDMCDCFQSSSPQTSLSLFASSQKSNNVIQTKLTKYQIGLIYAFGLIMAFFITSVIMHILKKKIRTKSSILRDQIQNGEYFMFKQD
eukprot:403353901